MSALSGCRCGRFVIPSADKDWNFRAPCCGSFLADHEWWWGNSWDEADAGRCGDCDGRAHSHGRPPADTSPAAYDRALTRSLALARTWTDRQRR